MFHFAFQPFFRDASVDLRSHRSFWRQRKFERRRLALEEAAVAVVVVAAAVVAMVALRNSGGPTNHHHHHLQLASGPGTLSAPR